MRSGTTPGGGKNLIYQADFVSAPRRQKLLTELSLLHPIWEMRFSNSNPPPAGSEQRRLLRPVYWLGNWQFACLNYYHPPKGLEFRCVRAEPFPPEMQNMVDEIQHRVRNEFASKDVPPRWQLNTCLINYYGSQIDGSKKIDVARVGEHKDFEPGPVASVSFGERTLFQFVRSGHKQSPSQVVLQQWLDDGSLQIFGGDKFKKQLFHRVQRVESRNQIPFDVNTPQFETRRLNFTFRFVPPEHIQPFQRFPDHLKEDIRPYMKKLAERSPYFASQLQG